VHGGIARLKIQKEKRFTNSTPVGLGDKKKAIQKN
jgi:hypothetical protein